jgi:hypothetical protein
MTFSTNPGIPRIERFVHRPYETVRSDDLRDQDAVETALSYWHNRALHQTYGVVFGLDISLVDQTPGAWRFRVEKGLAYDASGQPLPIVAPGVEFAIPYDPMGMTLVLRGGPTGPVLAWVPTQGFQITDGVGLAKTLARILINDIVFHPDQLPAGLRNKVTYDPAQPLLTIFGPLSEYQYKALRAATDPASQDKIEVAYASWPLDAPRQPSRIIVGLDVAIHPGIAADGTLWTAVVGRGSAVTESGEIVTLPQDDRLPLNGKKGESYLVVQAPKQGKRLALLKGQPTVQDRAVLLKLVTPGTGPPLTFRDSIPQIPAITTRLQLLTDKVDPDSHNLTLALTGFLTTDEAVALIDVVSATDIGRVPNVHAKLTQKPQPKDLLLPQERPPFFPIRSRPLARPQTATGASIPEQTSWKKVLAWAWKPSDSDTKPPFSAFETTLNIESAGFTTVPQLFAWLEHLPIPELEWTTIPNGKSLGPARTVFRGDVKDERTTIKEFVFRAWAPARLDPNGDEPDDARLAYLLSRYYYVRWFAVQSAVAPAGHPGGM